MGDHEIVLGYLELLFSWPFLAFLALLLFRSILARGLTLLSERMTKAIVSGQTFEFGVLSEKLRNQEGKLSNQARQIRALQIVIKGLVTKFEHEKLVGLAGNLAFLVRYHSRMLSELERLDAIEYVAPVPGRGLIDIQDEDGKSAEFDLKQYVMITERGREYLRLLEQSGGVL